jgi:hypothetical protein
MGINLYGFNQSTEIVPPNLPDNLLQKKDSTSGTSPLKQGPISVIPANPSSATAVTTQPKPAPILTSGTTLPLNQWTEPYVKTSIKNKGAASVFGEFSQFEKTELEKIKDKIEWIKDLSDEINKTLNNAEMDIRTNLTILAKDIELMLAYYKDCFDELQNFEFGGDSVYENCIKNLKKMQAAIQNLRNTVGAILERVRLMAAKEDNPDLKKIKRELKLIDDYCREIMAIIDYLIERLTLLLRVYHEFSFEVRNKGLVGTQTTRSL